MPSLVPGQTSKLQPGPTAGDLLHMRGQGESSVDVIVLVQDEAIINQLYLIIENE